MSLTETCFCLQLYGTSKVRSLTEHSCAILISFNKNSEIQTKSADVILKMTTILKEMRIAQLCSKSECTLVRVQASATMQCRFLFKMNKTKEYSKKLIVKRSGKYFISLHTFYLGTFLIVWLIKAPKNFKKGSHFENMKAGFLRRCPNSLWQTEGQLISKGLCFFNSPKNQQTISAPVS